MNAISCHECRQHLVSYVQNQAAPRQRRRVALHLQTCEACYARYVRERDLSRELRAAIPRLDSPAPAQMTRVWHGIQRDLARADAGHRPDRGQYGAVCLLLMLILLLPWSLGRVSVSRAMPPPPPPALARTGAVPTGTESGATAIVMATDALLPGATETVIPPAETPDQLTGTPFFE